MDRVFVFWKLSADFDENKISGRACSSLASIGGSIIDMEFVSPDNRCLISTSDPAGKIIIFDCQNINEGSENIEKEFLIQARVSIKFGFVFFFCKIGLRFIFSSYF